MSFGYVGISGTLGNIASRLHWIARCMFPWEARLAIWAPLHHTWLGSGDFGPTSHDISSAIISVSGEKAKGPLKRSEMQAKSTDHRFLWVNIKTSLILTLGPYSKYYMIEIQGSKQVQQQEQKKPSRHPPTKNTWNIPSGKRSHNYGKSPVFIGKTHYKWPCSIAMSVITRGYHFVLIKDVQKIARHMRHQAF